VAFVLRYIEPLIHDIPRPVASIDTVISVSRRPEIVRVLMFGKRDDRLAALRTAYDAQSDYQAALPIIQQADDWQTKIFKETVAALTSTNWPGIDESTRRVVNDYALYFLKPAPSKKGQPHSGGEEACELANRIYRFLHSTPSVSLADFWAAVTNRHRVAVLTTTFRAFVDRSIQKPYNMELTGQALGYLNEYERRNRRNAGYARIFLGSAVSLATLLIALAVILRLPEGSLSLYLAFAVLAFVLVDCAVVPLALAMVVFSAYDNYTWAQAALNTLDLLIGPLD